MRALDWRTVRFFWNWTHVIGVRVVSLSQVAFLLRIFAPSLFFSYFPSLPFFFFFLLNWFIYWKLVTKRERGRERKRISSPGSLPRWLGAAKEILVWSVTLQFVLHINGKTFEIASLKVKKKKIDWLAFVISECSFLIWISVKPLCWEDGDQFIAVLFSSYYLKN